MWARCNGHITSSLRPVSWQRRVSLPNARGFPSSRTTYKPCPSDQSIHGCCVLCNFVFMAVSYGNPRSSHQPCPNPAACAPLGMSPSGPRPATYRRAMRQRQHGSGGTIRRICAVIRKTWQHAIHVCGDRHCRRRGRKIFYHAALATRYGRGPIESQP